MFLSCPFRIKSLAVPMAIPEINGTPVKDTKLFQTSRHFHAWILSKNIGNTEILIKNGKFVSLAKNIKNGKFISLAKIKNVYFRESLSSDILNFLPKMRLFWWWQIFSGNVSKVLEILCILYGVGQWSMEQHSGTCILKHHIDRHMILMFCKNDV